MIGTQQLVWIANLYKTRLSKWHWHLDPTHCAIFDTRCTPLLVTREEIGHDFSY